MANDLVIRVAANLDALKANLAQGLGQIEITSQALARASSAFDGSKIIQQAGAAAAAIQQMGGVTNLTAAEQDRANTLIQAALDKYAALGKEAPSGLQALADATDRTSRSWEDFVSKFDVRTAITDPIGTAKDGLAAFAETLGPEGAALVGVAAAAAALGAAMYDVASHAAEAGEDVLNFSRITGATVESIGTLAAAATIGGSSLDGLQSMLIQMQRRLDETGPAAEKFDAALVDLGINANIFRAADPTQRIAMLSAGMHDAAGSTTMMSDALAIMGRGALQSMPLLLKNFDDLQARGAALGYQWSVEDTAASEKFNESLAALEVGLSTLTTTAGVALLPVMTALTEGTLRFGEAIINVTGLPGYIELFHALTGAMGENALKDEELLAVQDSVNHMFAVAKTEGLSYGDALTEVATKLVDQGFKQQQIAQLTGLTVAQVQALTVELKTQREAAADYTSAWDRISLAFQNANPSIENLSSNTKGLVADMHDAGVSVTDMATATGLSVQAVQALVSVQSAHEKAMAVEAAAMTELAAAGQGWRGTLEMIDGGVVEAIKYYLEAGVSQNALATAYGLTAVQIKAVATELKDETDATGKATKAAQDFATAWANLTAVSDGYSATLDTIDGTVVEAVKYYLQQGASVRDLAVAYGLTVTQVQAVDAAMKAGKNSFDAMSVAANNALNILQIVDQLFGVLGKDGVVTFDTLGDAIQAMNDGLDVSKIKVQALDGTVRTLADAIKQLDMGSSTTYDLSTDIGFDAFKKANPGAAINMSEADIEAFIKGGGTIQQLVQSGVINLYAGLEEKYGMGPGNAEASIPHFASGGPVMTDGPIYAHAGEFVVPAGGALVGGGGVSIAPGAIVMHFNYPIMNDPQARAALVEVVSDGLMRKLTALGVRAPARA